MRGVVRLWSYTSQMSDRLRRRHRRAGPCACRTTLPTSSLTNSSVLMASSSRSQAASRSWTWARACPAAQDPARLDEAFLHVPGGGLDETVRAEHQQTLAGQAYLVDVEGRFGSATGRVDGQFQTVHRAVGMHHEWRRPTRSDSVAIGEATSLSGEQDSTSKELLRLTPAETARQPETYGRRHLHRKHCRHRRRQLHRPIRNPREKPHPFSCPERNPTVRSPEHETSDESSSRRAAIRGYSRNRS